MGEKGKRLRLKPDEVEVINNYRAIKNQADDFNLDPRTIHSGWLKSKDASIYFTNPLHGDKVTYEEIKEKFKKELIDYAPKYPTIKRGKQKEPHLFVLSVSDLHIGKLATKSGTGETYNVKKAIERAKEAVTGLIDRASGYEIDQILLPVGNDLLHTDNSIGTTTKGTLQDTTGTWHENFTAARKLFVELIEYLMLIADVRVVHVPSNHDYVTGYCLTDALSCWFHNSKNVEFDLNMRHRKYFKYKKNLIGLTHGDGAKMAELPLIMANESPDGWASSTYRYFYLGHIHHKDVFKFRSGKDYHGVTVEYLRSPSSSDQWHHNKGYQHSTKAVEAFLHHPTFGQVSRLTYNF